MSKDTQRSKVYASERFLSNGARVKPLSWSECDALIKKVSSSAYVLKKYGRRYPRLEEGGRSRGVAYSSGKITLGVWARQEYVVIHELAHIYAGSGHGHDWKFCEVLLDLVRHFIGKDVAAELKASMKQHRVKFTAPRPKRELSPERKAALVEQLAAARAARPKVEPKPKEEKLSRAMIDELCTFTHYRNHPLQVRVHPRQKTNVFAALERRGLITLEGAGIWKRALITEAGIVAYDRYLASAGRPALDQLQVIS